MSHILIVTYAFPPLGGSGVQRVTKFVRYLPRYGHRITVLTTDHRWIRSPYHDPALLQQIPPETRIARAGYPDPNWFFRVLYGLKMPGVVEWISGRLLFPDYQRLWLPFARRAMEKLFRSDPPDVLLITSPPHSLHELGIWANQRYGIPWIADFRDPISYNIVPHPQPERARRYEKRVFEHATLSLAVTRSMRQKFLEISGVHPGKIICLPNGYDEEDFRGVDSQNSGEAPFTFVYTGKLYGRHNATALLKAIDAVRNELGAVRFRFVGGLTPSDRAMIDSLDLGEMVQERPYVPHPQAIAETMAADVLIALIPPGQSAYCVSSKMYEYIRSGRPVLGVGPAVGELADILSHSGCGLVVPPEETEQIGAWLVRLTKEGSGALDTAPDAERIGRFERSRQAGILSRLIARVVSES